uniref:LOW QUALITY PROTEIN: type I inositol polyphosphate 5-phosphatase 1-like n=1 Tax=Erigeron canadensis TaxID=72917 RepID=UPI001CB9BDE2|nr:LOW QUALITY PROTEIN: type I inositol polyphosphate 5-phosphatase 1-like [Erigeron canadensis]
MTHDNHGQRSRSRSPERNWVEKCLGCNCVELLWPRLVIQKWLNISTDSSDYSADSDDNSLHDPIIRAESLCYRPKGSGFNDNKGDEFKGHHHKGDFPRLRRRKSETFRDQFIDAKELRVSVNTWNLGGEFPPEDLDISEWLDTEYPADIYVIGFQEIIPLNAGNIFGSEDTRPIPIWENIIRENLNKLNLVNTEYKCYSDPPSPLRFKLSEDAPNMHSELPVESDTESEDEMCTFSDSVTKYPVEKIEEFVDSFKDSKSFVNYRPLESYLSGGRRVRPVVNGLAKLDLDSIMYRKRKSQYVRIVSKQMVGVFLTIWVRRSLRKHIQNVHVSTVGVGVMGYIGNKGSISVSMSVYQTNFCFICAHLTSGEREIDIIKRNIDVNEIYKRTRFNSMSKVALPRSIKDHERIIWFGDLNYRFNLSYEEACDLISKKAWSELLERDQLRDGGAFDGWEEGTLNFPPTYKYEPNSDKYCGEDPKAGRRTPAWCDRILSFGKGMRQLSYKRIENRLSDHRPVSASYMIDVEVFSLRKLQRALTFTDTEIQNYGISHLRNAKDTLDGNDQDSTN